MSIQDRYKNQYFSILGDSISTLDGYSQPKYAAYYDIARKYESGVFTPSDTWWGQVIEHFGGTLLVNNSISGSTVCKHCLYENPSYGCSDERTAALSFNGRDPDVIMIFMGINDWGYGIKPTPCDISEEVDLSIFSVAYKTMLEKLRKNYPAAELWCFTLPVSICKNRENFVFPYRRSGRHVEEYCEAVRFCAEKYGCRIIDLYRPTTPYDTIDGFHPNAEGMKTLAEAVIDQL